MARSKGPKPANGMPRPEAIKKGTFGRALKYLFCQKTICALIFISLVISAAVMIFSNTALRELVNYIAPASGVPNVSGFWTMIIVLGISFAVAVVADWVTQRFSMQLAEKIMHKVRGDLFAKMQELPISYFDKRTVGESMSLFANDADMFRELIQNAVPQIFQAALMLLAILAFLLYYNAVLALISIALYVVVFMFAGIFFKLAGKLFVKRQEHIADVNGYAEEMLTGVKVVKVFCREGRAMARFNEKVERLRQCSRDANTFTNLMMPLMNTISSVVSVIVFVIGTVFVLQGTFAGSVLPTFGLGELLAFIALIGFVGNPIGTFAEQSQNVAKGLAGASRIFRVMDETPEENKGTFALVKADDGAAWYWERGSERIPVRGDVRFFDVTFSYDGKKTVLDDISLFAKPGQKIAFVGATGAGKTTITNLINRFYDIDEGTITYDGIPIREIEKSSLRRSLSVVLQDTHLFSGTVMDNIRYGRLDANDSECIAAAKLASAHSFIMRLPNGYETELSGDGESLSQGQRQLLSIARAAVADAPVLILDEATSSVDTRTEMHIEHGMDRLMLGRTVFVIAHRLSTVRNSKAIMVLEDGRIIERGSHEDLLKEKGKYYQLYTGAFELA